MVNNKNKTIKLIILLLIFILLSSCTFNKKKLFIVQKIHTYQYILDTQSLWKITITRLDKIKFIGLIYIIKNKSNIIAILYDTLGITLEKIKILNINKKNYIETDVYCKLIKNTELPFIMKHIITTLYQINKIPFNTSKQKYFIIKKHIFFFPIKEITISFRKNKTQISISWPLLFTKVNLIKVEMGARVYDK